MTELTDKDFELPGACSPVLEGPSTEFLLWVPVRPGPFTLHTVIPSSPPLRSSWQLLLFVCGEASLRTEWPPGRKDAVLSVNQRTELTADAFGKVRARQALADDSEC